MIQNIQNLFFIFYKCILNSNNYACHDIYEISLIYTVILPHIYTFFTLSCNAFFACHKIFVFQSIFLEWNRIGKMCFGGFSLKDFLIRIKRNPSDFISFCAFHLALLGVFNMIVSWNCTANGLDRGHPLALELTHFSS